MEVNNDLYDIATRVKEIDPAYFIEYNGENGKFELHSHRLRPTFVLSFPFGELDARAIMYALQTRAERQDALIKEIEDNNLKIERDAMYSAKQQTFEQIERGIQQCK